MPSNRNPPDGDGNNAHDKVLDAIAKAKSVKEAAPGEEQEKDQPKASFSARRLYEGGIRRLDEIAANDRRRLAASVMVALAINIAVLSALAIFGRIKILAPNAPAQTISIVFVEEPVEPIFPELRDPEIIPEPEPEPEPEEPEIVEEPELVEEPEPEPEPEPEETPPAPEPQEPEPEPEPEPVLDFTKEPLFAPPSDEPPAPLIPETEPVETPGPLDAEAAESGDDAPFDQVTEEEQSPAEEADPLLEEETLDAGLEVTEEESAEDGDMNVGDDAPLEVTEPEEIGDEEEEQITGDDMFDEEPRFIQPRTALPLPSVDLPEGETAAIPGQSGVVAIFCPEEFADEDKQKECAGRTQIRSGWRPGASGESWDEAIRLLKKERREGGAGNAPITVFPPSTARRLEDEQTNRDLTDFRRSQDGVNNLPQTNDNLGDALGRPDIGPDEFEPSWAKREDPIFDQEDIDELEKALEEAEKDKQ